MIGNTPRRETNIYVEANKSFAFGIHFINAVSEGDLDLTGTTVRLTASQQPHLGGVEVLRIEAVHIADVQGLVQFQFQASDLALGYGSYSYDVTLITTQGYSVPILKGYIEVGANTDQDISNTFTDIHADSEITAAIGDSNLVEITVERIDGMLSVTQGLILDFEARMDDRVERAETAATSAEYWSGKTTEDIAGLKTWMANTGFPYWKGTSAQYAALGAPDPSILYLLTD